MSFDQLFPPTNTHIYVYINMYVHVRSNERESYHGIQDLPTLTKECNEFFKVYTTIDSHIHHLAFDEPVRLQLVGRETDQRSVGNLSRQSHPLT